MLHLPLTWLLVAAPATGIGQPPGCEAHLRDVQLSSVPTASPPEVCISVGVVTGIRFDGPLVSGSVEVEGEGDFIIGQMRDKDVMLRPVKSLSVGTRRRLTVRYDDGDTQQRVTLVLVAVEGEMPRQVNVTRERRTEDFWRLEAEKQRARADALEKQLAGESKSCIGFICAVRDGLVTAGESWVAKPVDSRQWKVTGGPTFYSANAYGAPAPGGRRRVVVVLEMHDEAWMLESASLLVQGRELSGVMAERDKATKQVAVEVVASEQDVSGPVTLKLRGGGQELTVEGIMFPR